MVKTLCIHLRNRQLSRMTRQYRWTKTNQELGTDSRRLVVRLLPSQENRLTWPQIERHIHLEISNSKIQLNQIRPAAIEHLFRIIPGHEPEATSMKTSRTSRTTLPRTLNFQKPRLPHSSKVTIRQNTMSSVCSSRNTSRSNRQPLSTITATHYTPSSRLLQTTLQETPPHLFSRQRRELLLPISTAWRIRPLSWGRMLVPAEKIWILRTSTVRSSCAPNETSNYWES